MLPAKRTLATNLVPSAWLNDEFIAERKKGLSTYLRNLIQSTQLQDHPILIQFLTPGPFDPFGTPQIELGDPFVQMGSISPVSIGVNFGQSRAVIHSAKVESDRDHRGDPEPIAAAYYPSWAVDALSPEKVVFSKFDIIFFCEW